MFLGRVAKLIASISTAGYNFFICKKDSCLVYVQLFKVKELPNGSQLKTFLCSPCVVGVRQRIGSPLKHFPHYTHSRHCPDYTPVQRYNEKFTPERKIHTSFRFDPVYRTSLPYYISARQWGGAHKHSLHLLLLKISWAGPSLEPILALWSKSLPPSTVESEKLQAGRHLPNQVAATAHSGVDIRYQHWDTYLSICWRFIHNNLHA